jgi:hypothetical protein
MMMVRSKMGESIKCQAAKIRKRLAFLRMIEAVLATAGYRQERPTSNWNEVGSPRSPKKILHAATCRVCRIPTPGRRSSAADAAFAPTGPIIRRDVAQTRQPPNGTFQRVSKYKTLPASH